MKWTSQGLGGLPAWRDRMEESERAIRERGGQLLSAYVTLGRYDVVEIFEAPSDETAAEILMKLQRFGAEHTETLRANLFAVDFDAVVLRDERIELSRLAVDANASGFDQLVGGAT